MRKQRQIKNENRKDKMELKIKAVLNSKIYSGVPTCPASTEPQFKTSTVSPHQKKKKRKKR
jgi:hypothetical protein